MGDVPALTTEIVVTLALIATTIGLLSSAVLRVDVVALGMLVVLGLLHYLPGLEPLIPIDELFSGFSSGAVIAILAIMILGGGLENSGAMDHVARWILLRGGRRETRVLPLLTTSAAVVSMFVQNIGVAALYLPVVNRIAQRTGIAPGRLLMPMAFCVILGGTATMVGSSPLIMLNDLLESTNRTLPAAERIDPIGLFDILPVGLALMISGIAYFQFAGRHLLRGQTVAQSQRASDYFRAQYGIDGDFVEVQASIDSPLVGQTLRRITERHDDCPFIVALYNGDVVKVPPVPDETVWVGTRLGLMGDRRRIETFCAHIGWTVHGEPRRFADVLNAQHGGIAEVVVPPRSSLVGRAVSEIKPRRHFGLNILKILRAGHVLDGPFTDMRIKSGDTLVVHASWKALHRLEQDRDFVVATDVRYRPVRPHKTVPALACFGGSMLLFLASGELSISLLAGALGMILSGVLDIDEAYDAISWRTVFLLTGLIPLGLAAEYTGAAAWLAWQLVAQIGEVSELAVQVAIAGLAALFTLVMSNVGATVLLVPLAVNVALTIEADPTLFALIAAIGTSNTFLLPTNQVNALIIGPGNYRVTDFLKVGIAMTLIFAVVSLVVLNLLY